MSKVKSDSVRSLRKAWPTLRPVDVGYLPGDWHAGFVSPLRTIAPRGLALVGLANWYGKRFRRIDGTLRGANLVRVNDDLAETLPMTISAGISQSDGEPVVVISYPTHARWPWPRITDELRAVDSNTLVGMTYFNAPLVRRLGLPFVLRRALN